MISYLIQFSLSPAGWSEVLENPAAYRGDMLRGIVERFGGRIRDMWLTSGDCDCLVVLDLPDTVSAAAISIGYSATGRFKNIRVATLLTLEEGQKAILKATGPAAAGE